MNPNTKTLQQIGAVFILCTLLQSCKKEYYCTCTIVEASYTGSYSPTPDTGRTEVTTMHDTRRNAERECKSKEKQEHDHTHIYDVTCKLP